MPRSVIDKKENDIVDVVIIIGKDRPSEVIMQEFVQSIKSTCKNRNLTFYIVGDGESLVDPEEIRKLMKVRHAIFYAHGSVNNKQHIINIFNNHSNISHQIIKLVQEQTGAKNIIFCCCFGGTATENIRNSPYPVLEQGTSFFAPSAADDISFSDKNSKIIHAYVNKISPSKKASVISFVADVIKIIPESMVYLHQPEYTYHNYQQTISHVIKRSDRKNYLDADQYCKYLIDEFNKFIDKIILDGKCHSLISELQDNYLDFKIYKEKLAISCNAPGLVPVGMTPEEKELFQELSLDTYVEHNDVNIVDSLLQTKNTRFNADLLARAILFHGLKYDRQDMTSMVEVLLKHIANCNLGQNVNTFAPDITLSDYYPIHNKYGFLKASIMLLYSPLTLALMKGDLSLDHIKVFNLKPINTGVVKVLLDKGADMYCPDSLGNIPANFLRQRKYQSLFGNKLKEVKGIKSFMIYAETILNNVNDKEIEYKDIYNIIKNLSFKYAEWKRLSEMNKDMNLFECKRYPPKTKAVFNAYNDFLVLANEIPLRESLDMLLENQRLTLISKLKNQVKLNTNLFGVTVDTDKMEILQHHLQMLFSKKRDDTKRDDKLQKYPFLVELCIQVTDHLNEMEKIHKTFESKTFEPVSQAKNRNGMTL